MKSIYGLFFALVSSWFIGQKAHGQISPPGLDDTKMASWLAIGLNQKFASKWSTTIYAGGGMQSDPDNLALFTKPSIAVFNQETLFEMTHHWQLAFCSSYRMQARYQKDAPYDPANPEQRDEIRLYLRLFYRTKIGKTNFSYSFRPEYRKFYTDHDEWYPQPVELRFRLKGQANFQLSQTLSLQLIIADEFLSAVDQVHDAQGDLVWSDYHLTENRLSTYLRKTIKKPQAFVDVGMMHQFRIDDGKINYIAHMAVDIIFQNLFSRKSN